MKCVYKISCKDKEITEFYIGSSVDFENRKLAHKKDSKNVNHSNYCIPLYMFINVNGGIENWEYEVIKEFPNHNKKQLNIEEQKYILLLKPELNSSNSYGLDRKRRKEYLKLQYKIKVNAL